MRGTHSWRIGGHIHGIRGAGAVGKTLYISIHPGLNVRRSRWGGQLIEGSERSEVAGMVVGELPAALDAAVDELGGRVLDIVDAPEPEAPKAEEPQDGI